VSLPLASLLEGSSVAQLTGIVLEQMAFDASPKPGQTPQATVSPPLQNAVESASMVQVAADSSNQLVNGTPSDASILEPTTTVGEVSELAHAAANMAASLPPSRPVKPVQAEAPGSASARGETAIDSGSINSRWTPLQKFVKRALAAFFRLVARVEVAGLDNIPRSGRVLLACNHLSMIDLPLIATILPRRGAVMAADRLQALPWVRWFLDLGDRIYIRRSEADQEALSQGLAVLRAGGMLGVSPEGTRSRTGGLTRGHCGVAYLVRGVVGTDPPGCALWPRTDPTQCEAFAPHPGASAGRLTHPARARREERCPASA
jgi:1-acyl-sn-glycerol-3-phosphate acyltransferase